MGGKVGDNSKTYLSIYKNKENLVDSMRSLKFIEAKDLKNLCQNNVKTDIGGKVVVQFAAKNIEEKMEKQLLSIGVDIVIPFDEVAHILIYKIKKNYIKNNPFLKCDYYANQESSMAIKQYEFNEYVLCNFEKKQLLFICMMPKTGDHTLTNTFLKNDIPCKFTVHNTKVLENVIQLNSYKCKKIKITTAVREPLSTSISLLYQEFGGIHHTQTICRHNLDEKSWLEDGGNVQEIFNTRYNYNNDMLNPISNFMEGFKESILDLSKYPFDKKKGYSIIKEGNVEVFVYQLEKINDIVKDMSDWIGEKPFDKWEIANDASSKWISKSYKQAQKELQISQEFFDKCYNNEWVEHFYSKEDIEKFKSRWSSQLIK